MFVMTTEIPQVEQVRRGLGRFQLYNPQSAPYISILSWSVIITMHVSYPP